MAKRMKTKKERKFRWGTVLQAQHGVNRKELGVKFEVVNAVPATTGIVVSFKHATDDTKGARPLLRERCKTWHRESYCVRRRETSPSRYTSRKSLGVGSWDSGRKNCHTFYGNQKKL